MLRAKMVLGCLIALAAISGCSEQVSYEPAPLTDVPPGGDKEQRTESPQQPSADTGARSAPSPKAGQLPIDCALVTLNLPADWDGAPNDDGVWTYDLGNGTVTVSGEYTEQTDKTKQSDLVALARGPFKDGVTQVRGDGTVAGKGRSDAAVEWRLAKSASGSTQLVVVAYNHPGESAVEANVTVLDKAVGRATLSDVGTC